MDKEQEEEKERNYIREEYKRLVARRLRRERVQDDYARSFIDGDAFIQTCML